MGRRIDIHRSIADFSIKRSSFLRKSLNNFDISLSITVNEEMEKQYVYSAKEKFEKLKEKNPHIDTLRKTFGLDI